MIRIFGRWRAKRLAVRELADEIIANSGKDAYQLIRLRIVERVMNKQDVSFECRVKREIEKRLGIEPRVDTATRYLEENRRRKRR